MGENLLGEKTPCLLSPTPYTEQVPRAGDVVVGRLNFKGRTDLTTPGLAVCRRSSLRVAMTHRSTDHAHVGVATQVITLTG